MMRLVIHQALKDVRLLRAIFFVWPGLNLALHAVVLFGVFAYVPGTDAGATLEVAFNVLMGLNVGGFVAIAVLVFQLDPAVSTTAFWVTRPVPVRVLLAAKLLVLVAALVVLPVLCDLVTMLAAGLPGGRALGFVPDSLFLQVAWLLPVLALAAITTTLAQFVAAAAAEVAASLVVITGISFAWAPRAFAASFAGLASVIALVSIAVVLTAYVWRHSGRGIAAACLAPVLFSVVLTAWPASFASTWPGASWDGSGSPHGHVERTAFVAAAPGNRYSLPANAGEVLAVEATPRGYEVTVRQTGMRGLHRLPISYLLRNPRGEALNPGAITPVSEPFFTTVIPVPQTVAVIATKLVFPWRERSDTDLDTWVRGAVLVITER